ncbi:MAG: hypothetical protein Q8Q15_02040, partial [bacterium]|nr:hypothetical protein [bacterium]
MQNLTARVTKIVGTPNPKNWSQVYTFFPDDEEKKQKRGSLLTVLTLTTEVDEDEITSVGREILSRLHEEYYGETSSPIFEKITQTLEKISQEYTTKDGSLELVAAVLAGPVLYVAASEKGEVWLSRQGHLARILVGEEEKSVSASGNLEENDLVVLGTASFFKVCPVGVLKAAIETGDTIESLNTL